MVTIHDVARLARTSTATVSQALNRPDRVATKTRRRVLAAIRKLRYYPNLHARRLAAGFSRTFGLIVSDIQNPFFADAIRSFEARARHLGYDVLLNDTNYKPHLMRRATKAMFEQKVRGVAILTSEMSPRLIKELIEQRLAVVLMDFDLVGGRVSSIKFDYSSGVGQAVKHLYGLGHRRIAFVGGRSLKNIKARQVAYNKSVRRFGLEPGPILFGNQSVNGGYAAGIQFAQLSPRPTAIITMNDLTAIGVARAFYKSGLRIPQDVSVIGFDKTFLAEYSTPSLTTVDMHADLYGKIAVDSLHELSSTVGSQGREYVIPLDLVIGESTGPAPTDRTTVSPSVPLALNAERSQLDPENELEPVAVQP